MKDLIDKYGLKNCIFIALYLLDVYSGIEKNLYNETWKLLINQYNFDCKKLNKFVEDKIHCNEPLDNFIVSNSRTKDKMLLKYLKKLMQDNFDLSFIKNEMLLKDILN